MLNAKEVVGDVDVGDAASFLEKEIMSETLQKVSGHLL
mgnify:FL=1